MGNQWCSTAEVQSKSVHKRQFPLSVLKVSDFLQMQGRLDCHQVLKGQGLLHEWQIGMFVIFISHQWLGNRHPDPTGQRADVLRAGLKGLIDGSLQVVPPIIGMIYGQAPKLAPQTAKQIEEGYIFMDWFAIPQLHIASDDSFSELKSQQEMAIQSIPGYVEASSLFIAFAPEMQHVDRGVVCNYTSWLSRGWCRLELWCRLLSNKSDTTVIVLHSATEAEFMFQLDWQHNNIADGEFTVEDDRAVVVKLGEMAAAGKIQHLWYAGPLHDYRFYLANKTNLMGEAPRSFDAEEFLEEFRFGTLEDAVKDKTPMTSILCAILAGDVKMLRLLTESRADINARTQGLGHLGYYDSMTPLMIATRSNQNMSMLSTLLELKADLDARTSTGVNVAFLARSPDSVDLLVKARGDFETGALPVGLTALCGAAGLASAETMAAMLTARCDVNPKNLGIGWSPLHATALFSRGNRDAKRKAQMLIEHRADINRPASMTGPFRLICTMARVEASIRGLSSCSSGTRFFASNSGITPLGMAALVGDRVLADLFLKMGAYDIPNQRGDLPEEIASANQHRHVLSSLAMISASY